MSKSARPKAKFQRGQVRPSFDSLFDPTGTPDPLDAMTYTGNPEKDATAEMSEALRAIIEQKRAMREVYRTTTDPEFWFAVCFQSREQKDEFLRLAGWDNFGDKYIDGLRVAEALHIPIEPISVAPLGKRLAPKFTRGAAKIGETEQQGGDS